MQYAAVASVLARVAQQATRSAALVHPQQSLLHALPNTELAQERQSSHSAGPSAQVWNLRVLHTPLAIAYAASTVQVQGIVQCAQLYNVSSILPKQAASQVVHWPVPSPTAAEAALCPSGRSLLITDQHALRHLQHQTWQLPDKVACRCI